MAPPSVRIPSLASLATLAMLGTPALAPAQEGGATLLKADLVRILTGDTYTPEEVAAIVRRNCLAFEPSEREMRQFRSLGADERAMEEIERCGTADGGEDGTATSTASAADPEEAAPTAPTAPDRVATGKPSRRPEPAGGSAAGVPVVADVLPDPLFRDDGSNRAPTVVEIRLRDAEGHLLRGRKVRLRAESLSGPGLGEAMTDESGRAEVRLPDSALEGLGRVVVEVGGTVLAAVRVTGAAPARARPETRGPPAPETSSPSGSDAMSEEEIRRALSEATRHLVDDDAPRARALFTEILGAEPENVDAMIGRARALELEGDRAGAVGLYRRALALDPDRADARFRLERLAEPGSRRP